MASDSGRTGKDCAALSSSCSSFRQILQSEASIWSKCCDSEFRLSQDDIEVEAGTIFGTPPESGTSSGQQNPTDMGSEASSSVNRDPEAAATSGGDPFTVEQQIQAQTRTRMVREVYKLHFTRGKKYPGVYARARHVWSRLVKWTHQHIPTLSRSILPGATEAGLDLAEGALGVTLPASFRALYILHNGQLTPFDSLIGASEEVTATGLRCPVGAGSSLPDTSPSVQELYHTCFHGLLGSYSFYDHVVSTRLLPVQLAVIWTNKIRRYLSRHRRPAHPITRGVRRSSRGQPSSDSGDTAAEGQGGAGEREESTDGGPGAGEEGDAWAHRVLIAASFMKLDRGFHFTKMFFLDCRDGCVYVGGSDLLAGGAVLRCSPPVAAGIGGSGLLAWLEEYTRRLDSGMYRVRVIQEDYPYRGICLFPEIPPLCPEAITRRVRVRASALFVPEAMALGPPLPTNPLAWRTAAGEEEQREPLQSCYAYSIRMSFLSVEEATQRAPESDVGPVTMRSCQLRRRHWIIEEGGERVADVRGEAVVGKYPLLRQGEEEFVYQSCTQMSAEQGSIEGDFTFVPGSIMVPDGPEFEATVPKFLLQKPEYIF